MEPRLWIAAPFMIFICQTWTAFAMDFNKNFWKFITVEGQDHKIESKYLDKNEQF